MRLMIQMCYLFSILFTKFCNSILVAVINLILRNIMRKLTAKERNKTYTDYNLDVSFKLYVAMFANTAIIPIVTKPNKNDWFGVGGLVVDIYLNLILVNFINPLFYHYNWTLLFKKVRICKEKRKGHLSSMTQREANKIFEGTNFDIAKGYADINMILTTTAFYTPLMPLLPVISISGLLFHYWMQKYILFRKCKIPQSMGERMAMLVSANVPLIMFFYALGQFIFISALSEGSNQFCLPVMIITIGYYIIPKDILLHRFENTISRDDSETYKKNKRNFLTDYDRTNPLTSKEVTIKYLQDCEQMEDDQEKLEEIKKEKLKLQNSSTFDSIKIYEKSIF